MRKKYLPVLILIAAFNMSAQENKKSEKPSTVKTDSILLPSEAFDRMIIQDITYAIFGEGSPVSGIKLDVTKPEATISGIFQFKNKPWVIAGLEFKGGITDKNFSILKGQNEFNTAFEFKPSLHYIPSWNSAKYYTSNAPIARAKNEMISSEKKMVQDSFRVVAVIYNAHLSDFKDMMDLTENLPDSKTVTKSQKKIMVHFLKQIFKNDKLKIDSTWAFDDLLRVVPKADSNAMRTTFADGVVVTYKKYLKRFKNARTEELSKQIANVSVIWTKKVYWWFTVSPFAKAEKITQYHTKYKEQDSLYFKADYPISYGGNIMINNYQLWPEKTALFWKIGLGLSRANNLISLSSFNYETITPFFNYGNAATTKVKSGTAYNYQDIKWGYLTQLSGEVYILPLKSFFPGFYFSGSINSSKLYNLSNVASRENDKTLIPVEGGIIFNINSREKDKERNLLSISAYYRYEDVTDKRRVSKNNGIEETKDDFLKRNRSLGLKVGIPITLPQINNQ